MSFSERYSKLNPAQKQAVDTIDGPVIVIAGPGTGKTELLSVRAANILQKTDTLPENILCLTFTDSGANAMRERLTDIIGKDAYKVAIHTFHSFGSEVINQNGQYFYQGAHFRPADQLSSYQIIRGIFDGLQGSPIAGKLNDEYTYLNDSLTTISELKKSGLTSDELLQILDDNDKTIQITEDLLGPIFAGKISKNTAGMIAKTIEQIRHSDSQGTLPTIVPLAQVLADSLSLATDAAISDNSTKPMTAWRNQWFKKDSRGNFVLKSRERQVKLRALSLVYEQYLAQMQQAALYDFDDMILRVVHAMEIFDDLRFNLQEKYQYIMVDEFQDTNMAQMRILHNLTNNEIQGDTPNIMVVGDDDQAIYSFQGADISNIIDFRHNYPKAKIVTLTDNYRSSATILDGSRDIILQGGNRLENLFDDINKQLTAHNNQPDSGVTLHMAETSASERHFIVNDIRVRIDSGQLPGSIAVLTRRHHEINSLLPYFSKAGIAVSYERRDNILDLAPIKMIEQLSGLLIDIAGGHHDTVNAKLPQILTHEAWAIDPHKLWQLSLTAYDNRKRWLEVMAEDAITLPIHDWLIKMATKTVDTPLEQILDQIIGRPDTENEVAEFVSPLYNYFFSSDKLVSQPDEYLIYLDSLRTIRSKMREYRPDQTPTLASFIEFIDLNRRTGSVINITRQSVETDSAVNIMTAHKSKGLEFDTVYVVNAVDTVWGERARSRSRLISYPENLPLAPAGESDDERLRLFYVAITRAKRQLHICYSLTDDSGKNLMPAAFLLDSQWSTEKITLPSDTSQMIEAAELAWYQPIIRLETASMRDLLLPSLDRYKLSVTHMHNFLDVTRGGPAAFLLNNLLKFPSAKSPNAAYGTAIHNTLQQAHTHLAATGDRQTIDEVITNFAAILSQQHMAKTDFDNFLQKGTDALKVFLDQNYANFSISQRTELGFGGQHSIVGGAHLTGSLDLVDINPKTKQIIVTDYKTGKPANSWTGRTEYEKIKLHKYKQQLVFYKLLIENARDYRDYSVSTGIMQFVEPTAAGDILSIETTFDSQETARFIKLIEAVWTHIINLNLPDISTYDQSYKGILAFENDLIDGVI